jgi:hypothetical protein
MGILFLFISSVQRILKALLPDPHGCFRDYAVKRRFW